MWVAIRLIGQLADARQGLWFLTSNQKKQQRLVARVCLVRREGPTLPPSAARQVLVSCAREVGLAWPPGR